MRLLELLHDLAHDNSASRIGELLELAKMLIDCTTSAGTLPWRANENGAIDGRSDGDKLFCDGKPSTLSVERCACALRYRLLPPRVE
jgi:hypothetical protein